MSFFSEFKNMKNNDLEQISKSTLLRTLDESYTDFMYDTIDNMSQVLLKQEDNSYLAICKCAVDNFKGQYTMIRDRITNDEKIKEQETHINEMIHKINEIKDLSVSSFDVPNIIHGLKVLPSGKIEYEMINSIDLYYNLIKVSEYVDSLRVKYRDNLDSITKDVFECEYEGNDVLEYLKLIRFIKTNIIKIYDIYESYKKIIKFIYTNLSYVAAVWTNNKIGKGDSDENKV